MKKLFPVFIFALLAIVACNDDDDKSAPVPDVATAYIEAKYPGATIRHAEYDNGGLLEVEIWHDARLKDVYFDRANQWVYTEWDVALTELPEAVTTAVSTAYPDYRIDDANYEEHPDVSYYEIEVEKGGAERYLNITAEGEILSDFTETPGANIPSAVRTFLNEKYPDAVVRNAEYDRNGILEVEVLHNSILKDAYFNNANEWLLTEWDVAVANLPAVVTSAVSTAYPDYRIDDADYEERPNVVCYELEIEKGNFEKVVYVTPDGEVLESVL